MATGPLTESLRETLALFDEVQTPLTTGEVATRLDLGRRSTYDRLERLVERGELETKKVGASGRVWWRELSSTGNPTEPTRSRSGDSEPAAVDVLDGMEVGVFVLDEDLRIASVNQTVRRYFGIDRADVIGRDERTVLEEDVGPKVENSAEFVETVLATYENDSYTEQFECEVRPGGGRERRWLEYRSLPIQSGSYAGGRIELYIDATDRRERERELREEKAFVESLLDNQRDLVYAFDRDGEFLRWNDQLEEVTGYTSAELAEMGPTDFFAGEAAQEAAAAIERIFHAGETAILELPLETADGTTIPYEFSGAPLRDEQGAVVGLTGIGRDVSERKAKERELQRQRDELEDELHEMYERIDEAFLALDDEWRFTYVNERAQRILDRSAGALIGRNVWDAFPDAVGSPFQEQYERAIETQESVSFVEYYPPLEAWIEVSAYPSESGLSVYFRDVTTRKQFEQRLKALNATSGDLLAAESVREVSETVVETVADIFGLPGSVVYAYDEETDELVPTAQSIEADFMLEEFRPIPDDYNNIVSRVFNEGVPKYHEDVTDSPHLRIDPQETEMRTGSFIPLGEYGILVVGARAVDAFDDDTRRLLELLAVSAEAALTRVERERELERRVRQLEVVSALGQRALEYRDLDGLMAAAAELVSETLDTDYCKVLDLDEESGELLLRQGVGWEDGVVGRATVAAAEADSQAAYTLESEEPVVVEDLHTETRFSGPDLLTDHDVRSGISTIVGPRDDPWGILGTHDTGRRQFSEHDVNFVQSVANVLASAIRRHYDERELIRQRERLAAPSNLNEIAREITDAVIEQSTRDEIEQTVCDYFAASSSYEFAWIGDVESGSGTVNVRAVAGGPEPAEEATAAVHVDRGATGPIEDALGTNELQVARDLRSDPGREFWPKVFETADLESWAVVPIVHEGTLYGILNVYADRPNAFDDLERTMVRQLGEVVGHAIAATDRKRALMGDEVVELQYRVPNVFEVFGVESPSDGTITIDHAIPLGDGEFRVYGTSSQDEVEQLESLVERLDHWREVTFRGEDGDRTFELLLQEPPILSVVASMGGSIEEAVIEDGDYHMTIHLSPETDVRQVTETIQQVYPQAKLLKRQQRTRQEDPSDRIKHVVSTEFTDRQREALEAAYYSGFFEWPRETSGKEVAESLSVAPPTFHQHLRKAEKKLFDALFSGSATVR